MRFSISSSLPHSFVGFRAFQRAGLAALAGFSLVAGSLQSAQAGPSDPTAANLIANALPGETTSTSCNSNGFIVVRFMGSSGSSSSVESSTTCTPGGGGSTPPSTPGGGSPLSSDELQSMIEQDLLDQRIIGLGQDFLEDLSVSSLEEFEDQVDEAGETEFSDEEKAALLSKYRRELSRERSELAEAKRQLSDLRSQLSAARSEAASRLPGLAADLSAAEAALSRARADGPNLPTAMGVINAETKLDGLRRTAEEWAKRAQSVAYGRPEYARNMYGAAQARVAQAEQELETAKAAHETAYAAHIADAENAVNDAKRAISTNAATVQDLEKRVSDKELLVSLRQSNIASLESKIRALEAQNQVAGPSGDAFEVLRSRGLEFWSRGSVAFADDTQSGRNQEIEQKEITVGVQGRLSERLLLGLAASYVKGDNADQTGTGVSTDTDTFMVAPYLAYQLNEDFVLDASGVYGITDVSLTRATTATASYDSTTLGGQIGLSLRHRLSHVLSLSGRVGQSYVTTESDGYTDTGGVTIASSDNEQAATSFSGRVNISTDPDWRWHGGLRVRYDTIDPGNGVDRLYGNLSTGLEYNPGPYAVSVQASRTVFRSNYEATGLSLQVRVPF